MRGVDHLGLCGSPVPGKFPEKVFPDAAPRPANKPVIDRRRRTIFGWTIAPAATAFQHMHNAADNAPIVHSLDTSHIRWQMGLDALPLLIAQPKQIPPHDPDPPKRISSVWNQDCFATAPKLMSSHPNSYAIGARNSPPSPIARTLGIMPASPSVGTLPAQEVQHRVVEARRILQEGEMTCVG